MNLSEQVNLVVELQELWPGKYSETDLKIWTERLSQFPMPAVRAALADFKASHAYAPKYPEIIEKLPKANAPRPKDSATSMYEQQRDECNKAKKTQSESAEFCSHLSDEEYTSLRTEVIAAMPEKIRPIAEKVGRNHGLITSAIFELLKKQSAGYEVQR